MNSQSTNSILMIRPASFQLNKQTAINNFYQKEISTYTTTEIQNKSVQQFDAFAERLKKAGIEVHMLEDSLLPKTPDALFPNNWISFHNKNRAALYPMYAPNRRQERRQDVFEELQKSGYSYKVAFDESQQEENGRFLEGTGSLVLDRQNKIAYAALSPRTNKDLVDLFCSRFEYEALCFHAYQTVKNERKQIYHTNVMMSIGSTLAIICLDCIDDVEEKKMVREKIQDSGKELILISEKQVEQFAGNMLELASKSKTEKNYLVMSTQAYESLNTQQLNKINVHLQIIHSPLDLIETLGGGSARCMIAELF